MMGRASGAFETTLSDDPKDFTADNLALYDAVLLNNTTSFETTIGPTGQRALLDYVRGGKGLIGIHAAADSCQRWKEGTTLFGGVFAGHPWTSKGTWAFKLESPDHPLNRAFESRGFELHDEVYYLSGFSPARSRVLVSLDMTHDQNLGGPGFNKEMAKVVHPDGLYPVAWIHTVDKGRVFYSNLGHNPSTYWQPAVLDHYLRGIQFALGDLDADVTATDELSETKYVPAPAP